MDINKLLRKNIRDLKPYSSARDEFSEAGDFIFLDANENPMGSTGLAMKFNRYPDPYQTAVKKILCPIKGVQIEQTFLGNGSDEAIDLLFRAFCEPGEDQVIILPPTYGMYQVCANINNVELIRVNLKADFQIDVEKIKKEFNEKTKLLFICSPNNPTGNTIDSESIKSILKSFSGIVVLDEAYIDFCSEESMLNLLNEYPNLVILQTFSKAWGLANLRMGMAFASKEIIQVLNNIKYPYNINGLTQATVLKALGNEAVKNQMVKVIKEERAALVDELNKLGFVLKVYPSKSNFVLAKTKNALAIYSYLIKQDIIVRNRSTQVSCENCLRFTVGTKKENELLLAALKNMPETILN